MVPLRKGLNVTAPEVDLDRAAHITLMILASLEQWLHW